MQIGAGTEVYALGIMSGSSLDGLDLAICRFRLGDGANFTVTDWSVVRAATYAYPPTWRARLSTAPHLPGRELMRLHADLGHWIGKQTVAFLDGYAGPAIALVASHGHTVFHGPAEGFTTQIGDGAAIARRVSLPIITDFRSADVAHGGQGAPLAPVADHYLFPEYNALVNLGGIANLSVRTPRGFVAGDVSGCCQILDRLATKAGLSYDADGQMAATGNYRADFVETFAALEYHTRPYPKSLGNAWVVDELWTRIEAANITPADASHSFVKWLATRIALDIERIISGTEGGADAGAMEVVGAVADAAVRSKERSGAQNTTELTDPPRRVLLTGGGAHHDFLVAQLRATQRGRGAAGLAFVRPPNQLIDFKEAALMALCGVLRLAGRPNSFAAVTGAERDSVGGAVYWP